MDTTASISAVFRGCSPGANRSSSPADNAMVLAAGGGHCDSPVDHRDSQSLADLKKKFGAANRTGRERGVEFHIGRFFAIKEKQRAYGQSEFRFARRRGRKKFERGAFVQTNECFDR